MKRISAISLIVLIVFSLVGCGETKEAFDESKVQSNLVGQWGTTTEDGTKNAKIGYIFNTDGTASSVAFGPGADGTYVIEEGKVILTFESGNKVTFIYEYEDGNFKLKLESSEWWNLYKL